MDERNSYWIKIGIIAAVVLVLFLLLFNAKLLDLEQFQHQGEDLFANPHIEISPLEGEKVLVGDIVVEWLKGEHSGKDIYNQYAADSKVYTAKSVTVNYAIYDIPANVEVENQLVELSLDNAFEDSTEFELVGNKRSIRFDYLLPDQTYYFRITATLTNGTILAQNGQFKTADTPRIISTDGVWNMRDIGGVKTLDGHKTKLGMVYRGCELDGAIYERYCITPSGAQVLTQTLGIKAEIDLRDCKDNMRDMLGSDIKHNYYGVYAYEESLVEYNRENYRVLFSDLAKPENYPAYVHCTYGKDRTGTVCYLLQILLGVSEEDAYKEWELSVLLDGHIDYNLMDDYIDVLKKFGGDTMQQKVENYLISIGVTKAQIENIREILIEDYTSDYSDDKLEISKLENKKIVYDGDGMAMGLYGDGGYAQMIADFTGCEVVNFAIGGGRLVSLKEEENYHSVVDNLSNLPKDADLYCFQAGINDYWTYGILGTFTPDDFSGMLDTTTVCGALETIFRYIKAIDKPVVFIISHKIQQTADSQNAMGDTFGDYHDAMVEICKKYDVPYYDAFLDSGLDGSDSEHNELYLTGNSKGVPDGTHPNEDGYKQFYVPQLIELFEGILE